MELNLLNTVFLILSSSDLPFNIRQSMQDEFFSTFMGEQESEIRYLGLQGPHMNNVRSWVLALSGLYGQIRQSSTHHTWLIFLIWTAGQKLDKETRQVLNLPSEPLMVLPLIWCTTWFPFSHLQNKDAQQAASEFSFTPTLPQSIILILSMALCCSKMCKNSHSPRLSFLEHMLPISESVSPWELSLQQSPFLHLLKSELFLRVRGQCFLEVFLIPKLETDRSLPWTSK